MKGPGRLNELSSWIT